MAKKGYHPASKTYAKQLAEELGGGEWWDPKVGEKEQFRVFPAWDERGICIIRRILHYGFEVDGRRRAFPCLEDNATWLTPVPCPTCYVVARLLEGDEDERKIGKDLQAGGAKFVVKGVDCKKKQVAKWAAPFSFGKYFLALLEDKDIDDPTHPLKGFDIYVERSGKGRGTKYDYRMRPKSTPIPIKKWEKHLEDLTKTMEVLSPKKMISLLEDNYGNVLDLDGLLKGFKVSKEKTKTGKAGKTARPKRKRRKKR